MTELHFPFLEASVLVPAVGAVLVAATRDPRRAYRTAVLVAGLTLLAAVGAWQDFGVLHARPAHPSVAHDRWDVLALLSHHEVFVIDELTAPLLPMTALLYFLTVLGTHATKRPRFSFARTLLIESLILAAFSCRQPVGVLLLLILDTIPAFFDLKSRGRPTRLYVLHMAAFAVLGCAGTGGVALAGGSPGTGWLFVPLLLAVAIRSGLFPFHLWTIDLFEHAGFGTALLMLAPMTGAYAAIRLLIPFSPDWVLHGMGLLALLTAVYAAAMSLVQRDVRRYFCHLFLSHSALVVVGLDVVSPVGLAGGLCVWLSSAIALGGLGLVLRALEARFGRLSLDGFHGLYEHVPALAVGFAIAGLAGVGFPGTAGFIGTEMLMDGTVTTFPHVGVAVLVATAFNGISILRAYFLLFTGTKHASSVRLAAGKRERFSLAVVAALLLGGGLLPHRGVASRYEAAERVLADRKLVVRQNVAHVAAGAATEHAR